MGLLIAGIAGGTVLGILLSLIAGALFGSDKPAEKPTPSASAAKAKPPTSAKVANSEKPKTLADRALAGDEKAIQELSKKNRRERSAAEASANILARGVSKRQRLKNMKRKIELVEAYGREKATVKELKELANSRIVGMDTVQMLSELPGPIGPDLLFKIWTGTRKKHAVTELAEELLYSQEVYKKASKPLKSALDLRDEKDCEKMKGVLKTAIENGDRRSIAPLARLQQKFGCGENKRKDCWTCLRETDLVKDAIDATRKRAPPK